MSESRVIPPLRIAVLGDFEGIHTRRWLEVFVERGHEVHAISYYWPRVHLPGVHVHSLKPPPCRHRNRRLLDERPDGSPPPSTRKSAFAQLKTKVQWPRAAQPSTTPQRHALPSRRPQARRSTRSSRTSFTPTTPSSTASTARRQASTPTSSAPGAPTSWWSHTPSSAAASPNVRCTPPTSSRATTRRWSSAQSSLGVPQERTVLVHLGIDRVVPRCGRAAPSTCDRLRRRAHRRQHAGARASVQPRHRACVHSRWRERRCPARG